VREKIEYKSDDEIVAMRAAGLVVAAVHEATRKAIRPGVTPVQLDEIAAGVLAEHGARSNFLGYHGFPRTICVSVNDAVVHGIPSTTPLVEGDVVSVDAGAVVDGWHGDAAYSTVVGTGSKRDAHLVEATRLAMCRRAREREARDGRGPRGPGRGGRLRGRARCHPRRRP
jgi:methionyl aminopeptidase